MQATPAQAGGFSAQRFGGEQGTPVSANPTVTFYNPASMILAEGTHLYLEGVLAFRSLSYDRPTGAIDHLGAGTPTDAADANAGHASAGNLLASPFLGAITDLGMPDLRLGASFSVPYGGQVKWDQNTAFAGDQAYPGAVDGVQRWNIIEGESRLLYFTAAAAYRFRPARLTIGAAFNLIRTSLATVRARTPAGNDDLLTPSGELLEGRSLAEVAGWTYSVAAGLLYEASPSLALGLSYQSQPGFGEFGMNGTLTNRFNTTSESDVEMRQAYPDIVRAGLRWRRGRYQLQLSADYTRWSVMKDQCLLTRADPARKCAFLDDGSVDIAAGGAGVVTVVQRDLRDTYGGRIGGSYWLKPAIEGFAGVAWDRGAVPLHTMEASLSDANKVLASAGVRWEALCQRLWLTGTFLHVQYASRTSQPRPRDGSGEPLIQPPSRNPDGAGTYSQHIDALLIGAEYAF